MLDHAIRVRHPLTILSIAVLIVAFPDPGGAVISNIHNVVWSDDGAIPVDPGTTRLSLTFDADVWGGDPFDFVIGLRSPNGDLTNLLTFGGDVWLSRFVRTAGLEVSFSLSCDAVAGLLSASDPVGTVRYTPVGGAEIHGELRAVPAQGVRALGTTLELLVWDGQLVAGGPPKLLDALLCGGAPRTIGIYFDADATTCRGTIHPGTLGTVYVVAKLDPNASGIAGAEFRFSGVPAAWSTYPVANPETVTLGNPLESGVTVGFQCHPSEEGHFLLYRVLVLAAEEVADVRFTLESRNQPTNPAFRCPLLVNCGPTFLQYCVASEPCFVNSTMPTPCNAPMAAAERTWSAMKSLYLQPGR
jgi:hypothetical protein